MINPTITPMEASLTDSEKELVRQKVQIAARAREASRLRRLKQAQSDYQLTVSRIEELESSSSYLDALFIESGDRKIVRQIGDIFWELKKLQPQLPDVFLRLRTVEQEINRLLLDEPHVQKADEERFLESLVREKTRKLMQEAAVEEIRKRREQEELRRSILREWFAQEEKSRLAWLDRSTEEPPSQITAGRNQHKKGMTQGEDEILKILEDRGIKHLLHFTPLGNLTTICEQGILSRTSLSQLHVPYRWTDDQRLDGWFDFVSFSIEFPNYKMFFPKRQRSDGKWAVVVVDAKVLLKKFARYYPHNAGRYSALLHAEKKFEGAKALTSLFVKPRSELIPKAYPSDPQSEVMIEGGISPSDITEIHFETNITPELKASLANAGIQGVKDQKYFKPRIDFRNWRDRTFQEHESEG